ncbi:MAG: hypothetical protein U0798_03075 [Gemmataceae bacterium]
MRWSKLALSAALMTPCGCFFLNQQEEQRSLRSIFDTPINATDRVILDYRLIDQPAGDPFAVDQLWNMVTCPLSHERESLLAENGIRIGVVSGVIPPEFIDRVTSDRHVIEPRAFATKAGEEKIIPVNGPFEKVTTKVIRELASPPDSLDVKDGESGWAVQATPTDGGRLRFHCCPIVQSGMKQAWLRPTADRTQFKWEQSKVKDKLDTLAFDVTLGPGEYLVIGSTSQPGGTLGELLFFVAEPARVRQRFLVLRGRSEVGSPDAKSSIAAKAHESR